MTGVSASQTYSKRIIVLRNSLKTEIKRFITGRGIACSAVTASCLFILEQKKRDSEDKIIVFPDQIKEHRVPSHQSDYFRGN